MARGARSQPRMFVSNPIAEPEDEWRTVDLASLIAFFRNPTQFFIKKRLGINLSSGAGMLEEREPFALGSLAQYQIEENLLAKAISGTRAGTRNSFDPRFGVASAWALWHHQREKAMSRYESVRRHCRGTRQQQASSTGDDR